MIGILGGAFDPVHFGHLRPALELQQLLGLSRLLWIPTGQPAHRPAMQASGEQRAAMLELAIEGQPGWQVDRRELQRQGPAYMVDTLTELRSELGSDIPLCLLLGMDAFVGLPGWHRWRELFELAHLVVSQRPGSLTAQPDPELAQQLAQRRLESPQQLQGRAAGGVYLHPVSQLEISSTQIRALLASGQDPRFLLPEKVLTYIRSQGLYQP